jgi:hypothetical protein
VKNFFEGPLGLRLLFLLYLRPLCYLICLKSKTNSEKHRPEKSLNKKKGDDTTSGAVVYKQCNCCLFQKLYFSLLQNYLAINWLTTVLAVLSTSTSLEISLGKYRKRE